MTTLEMDSIQNLPVEQRIPVPKSHMQELNRRVEKYKNNPSALLDDHQLRDALA